ncbi:MAG TPA: caspase family protein [Saprospiraceae bacterium]|nr:caspase family protein [Saprospiraceae bacterium]
MKPRIFLALLLFPYFLLAQTPKLVIPVGHTQGVNGVALWPNGKLVLTGSSDKTAKLWDMKGRELQTFSGHTAGIHAVAFSPDGSQVLTGSADSTARLWDLSGKCLSTFQGSMGGITAVLFTPDGQNLLTGSEDGLIRKWDLSGRLLQTFMGLGDPVTSVSISKDGKMLVGAAQNKAMLLSLTGSLFGTITDPDATITSVAFSADDTRILTGNKKGNVRLWDLAGNLIRLFETRKRRSIFAVACSPDGKKVVTTHTEGRVTVWDMNGTELLVFKDHDFSFPVLSVAFSTDGQKILTGSGSGEAMLWQMDGSCLQTFRGHTSWDLSLAFSPSGKQLLIGRDDGSLRLWDLFGRETKSFGNREFSMLSVAFSSDGKQMAAGDVAGGIWVWPDQDDQAVLFDNSSSVWALSFSPDGNQILTGTGNEEEPSKLWNKDGQLLKTLNDHTSEVHTAAFSPDGKYVLTGGLDSTVCLFTASGKLVKRLGGYSARIESVAFSPDGTQILTCCADSTVKRMDLSGKILQTFRGQSSAMFSPDGKQILTHDESSDWPVLWDLSGRPVNSFKGHNDGILAAAFSPNGKFLATSSLDKTTKIWDIHTGLELATLIALDSTDWVVTTPSGLFDASDGARNLMHYVVDLNQEEIVIGLEQIQERYWQPGLLGAVLGLTPYPVRDVGVFDRLRLFPAFDDSTRIESDRLYIKLRERNSGLGKLSLIINGITRAEDLNPERKRDFTIDLKRFSRFLRLDSLNSIELEVYESGNELKSEPYQLFYQAMVQKRGEGSEEAAIANDCQTPRHLYLIVVGTSLYPQGMDSLPSANEDALEMARVLQEAGKQLYDDRVHLQLLATKGGESPSKANIEAAFQAYKKTSVCDVLVVFFAGHGANWGKDGDKSNFYYLTKDISFSKLNDEGVRKAYAISDQELKDWMREIPAENKLLILDACNSGQAAINMGGIIARNMDPDKILAFNLMSGNTGSYVISGSSESGASFESEVFGHGLLTYSLLEGINGTALDGSKVDVLPLLLKSYNRVGELAQSLGKEQTPIIAKPRGNASFYVGRNDGSIQIDLPESKPMVIQSFLFDSQSYVDNLNVTESLNTLFRSKVIKGKQAPWFYSDIPRHPQGFSVRGIYTVQADKKVKVQGRLIKGDTPQGKPFTIVGEPNARSLAQQIYQAVWMGIKLE